MNLFSNDSLASLGLLSVVGLLVVLYGIRFLATGRAQFARVDKQGGSLLLGKGAMEMAYWGLQPFARGLIALRITPNMISYLSLFLGFAAGICLAKGFFGYAGIFATVSGFLDTLDGMVARLTGVSSDAGEVLDATVDRYAEAFLISGLVIFYSGSFWIQVLALSALMGSFMVSYSTAKAEALQIDPPKGLMRRPERALYLTLGIVLTPVSVYHWESQAQGYPIVIALVVVSALSNLATVQRMYFIAKEIRKREARSSKK